MKKSAFFETDFGRVHALRFGQGAHLLIALHGFSDQAGLFAVLEKPLAERYTIVALDLPFHGQTEWQKDRFLKEDLLKIIAQVLENEGKTRFSLLGFSFGARLAQAMLPELAPQLDRLFLLSPDGIKTRGLTVAARTPMWIRLLLFQMLRHPNWLISLAGLGRKLGLVSAFSHGFLSKNLNQPARLRRTFGCWFSMDSFRFEKQKTQQILNETALPTQVYVGGKDPLLEHHVLKDWFGALPNVHVYVLDQEGHALTEGFALALLLPK